MIVKSETNLSRLFSSPYAGVMGICHEPTKQWSVAVFVNAEIQLYREQLVYKLKHYTTKPYSFLMWGIE